MADTVKLPGIGQVKTPYVIAGGALIAGIVGYAWWTRRSSAATPQWDVDSSGETSYVAPGANNSTYNAPKPEGTFSSNQAWANEALTWGLDHGYDFGVIAMAISRYLTKKPLNAKEAEFIQLATPQIGQPPDGGPFTIIPQAPGSGMGPSLPDLSRYGDVTKDGGSPWRLITVARGETWSDVALRAYAHDKSFTAGAPNFNDVVRFLQDLNSQIKTPQPQEGDVIVVR